jgi:uncharacterized protein
MSKQSDRKANNVLGTSLKSCCFDPKTGFYRDGYCHTTKSDFGTHIICAIMTDEFLKFSKEQGNDLITPYPGADFPGLKAGDKWCLCMNRWLEALDQDVAPKIDLEATHEKALEYVSLDVLRRYSLKDHDLH